MRFRRHTLLGLLLISIATVDVSAQLRWSRWYFGERGGIDFTGGTPTALVGNTATLEGTASVSDPYTGALLFYTDGRTIWNREHRAMPNGGNLLGNHSSTQSALIVPDPGDAARYYVFTVDAYEDLIEETGRYDGANYSVVDMTLDGGLGDVALRNVRMAPTRVTEKLCGIRSCGDGSYWAVMHAADARDFYAYHITADGIADPVVSRTGSMHKTYSPTPPRQSDLPGYMKSSPDGGRIALVYGSAGAEVFDFDPVTGAIELRFAIPDSIRNLYGVGFSPSGRLLYVRENTLARGRLLQYDLEAGTPEQVATSAIVVAELDRTGGAIQLGPDGRLYLATEGKRALDVITDPDVRGVGCNLVREAFPLRGGVSGWGLPNVIDSELGFGPTGSAGPDTALCPGGSVQLTASGGSRYRWLDAATLSCDDCASPVARPLRTTRYVVEIVGAAGCSVFDTVTVGVHDAASVGATAGGEICRGDTTTLAASGGVRWSWAPADGLSCTDCASPRAFPRSTTRYTVTAWSSGGCVASDTVSVVVHSVPFVVARGETTVCAGEAAQLGASGATSYRWSPSDGLSCTDCADPIVTSDVSRTYRVVGVTPSGCSSVDSVTVTVAPPSHILAWVDSTHTVAVGGFVAVPVLVSDPAATARETSLELDVTYDPEILRLLLVSSDGTLTEQGKVEAIAEGLGSIRLRIVPGRRLSDTLVVLGFRGYLADHIRGPVAIEIRPTSRCVTSGSRAGAVRLDSLCGLNMRLIEQYDPTTLAVRPNPFGEASTIEFTLGEPAHARLRIFDAMGVEVLRPVDGWHQAGVHAITLRSDDVPQGALVVRLEANGTTIERRVVRR